MIFPNPQTQLSRISLFWLVAVALAAALPHSLQLPAWASILFFLTVIVRIPFDGYQQRGWMRVLIAILGLIGGFAIFLHYGTLVGRDPGVALLVIAVGLKVLESYCLRDAMILLLLTYFVVVTHFFYAQGIPDSVYMLAVVVLTTMVMIQLSQGVGSLGWTSWMRHGVVMLIKSIPIMLILFVLFPRINGPLWSAGRDNRAVTGLGEKMAPGTISQLVRSNEVVFRASFAKSPPPKAQLYWRGPVLSEFDGMTWVAGEQSGPIPNAAYGNAPFAYDVVLEPHHKNWLFVLDLVQRLPPGSYLNAQYQLLSKSPVNQRRRYRALSSIDYTLGRSLSEKVRQRYLSLPESLSPRIKALVQEWRASQQDAWGIAEQALSFFHEQQFAYTLTPPLLSGDHTEQFLFATRSGFCEHYASGFVVLMRASGIPARIVTGYQGGEWNPMGRYLLVRQSDAHAWAEIWIEGQGWVRFDPTAAVSPGRVELGIDNVTEIDTAHRVTSGIGYFNYWRNRLRFAWDTLNLRWDEWVVSFGPQRQHEILAALGFNNTGWQTLVTLMVTSMAVLTLLYLSIFVWRNRPPRLDPVKKTYLRFRRKMRLARLEQWDHEGASDYAVRVAELRPEIGAQVKRIADLYYMLRYREQPDDEQLVELKQLIRSLRV